MTGVMYDRHREEAHPSIHIRYVISNYTIGERHATG